MKILFEGTEWQIQNLQTLIVLYPEMNLPIEAEKKLLKKIKS